MPSLLTFFSDVEPSPRAKAAARKRHYKIAGIVLFLLVSVATILVSEIGFALLYLAAPLIAMLRGLLNNDPPAEFVQAARAAEARLRGLQHAWQRDASGETFDAKLEDLRTLSNEYRHLPESRKAMVRELEKSLYVTQMRNYLQRFDIATADIPNIKEGRKAMLSAYGIDDAADITLPALESVPGFGSFLIMELVTWRQGLEAKFQFDPRRGIEPADIQRVDQRIAKRRAEIEALLSKGPSELKNLRRHIVAARGRLQGELETALRDVAQAQADERAA
jgi:DNA-binding helix-hairpin-helix protein with protein kinase domain